MNKQKEDELNSLFRWRELQDKERLRVANSFNKYLLTFATGTLYLSIYFTINIEGSLINKDLLGFGWVSLIISIIFTLLTIFLSDFAFSKGIEITDNLIRSIQGNLNSNKENNCWNFITVSLQIVGIVTFIVGVVLLSIVYYTNLK